MCLEIVRAMTYVINQGLALYWGTSRWGAAEIMVSVPPYIVLPHRWFPLVTQPLQTPLYCGRGGKEKERNILNLSLPQSNAGGLLHGQTV